MNQKIELMMNLKIRQLRRQDFPVIRDWIDANMFRIFQEPIDDSQLEILLTKYNDDGRPADLGLAALDIDEDNTEAVNFYYKMGFKTDGLMRDATKYNGKFISWYCMSLLDNEYL